MTFKLRGFTLIEVIVAVAVVGVLLTIAAPSMYDYILVQRLKSINAQLVTDLNFARSEAVTRNLPLTVGFDGDTNNTCYVLYTVPPDASSSQRCDCKLGPGAACGSTTLSEVRTTMIPRSSGVSLQVPASSVGRWVIAFDHTTGSLILSGTDRGGGLTSPFAAETSLSSTRLLRTTLSGSGRPTVCSVGNNLGAAAC